MVGDAGVGKTRLLVGRGAGTPRRLRMELDRERLVRSGGAVPLGSVVRPDHRRRARRGFGFVSAPAHLHEGHRQPTPTGMAVRSRRSPATRPSPAGSPRRSTCPPTRPSWPRPWSEVAQVYLERLLSSEGPRVIIVDDLHWLDPSSFGMIEEAVDAVTRYPALLLMSTRPGTSRHGLDRPSVTRLHLDGLSEPETARLATLVAKSGGRCRWRPEHPRANGRQSALHHGDRACLPR